MKHTHWLALILFSAVSSFADPVETSVPELNSDAVLLELAFDKSFQTTEVDLDSWDGLIFCRWRNHTSSEVSLRFQEDKYSTFPHQMYVRVLDNDGEMLTKNTNVSNGWWSFQIMISVVYFPDKRDHRILGPRESLTRIIRFQDIVAGLSMAQAAESAPIVDGVVDLTQTEIPDFEFHPGKNFLEIRHMDIVSSNRLTVKKREQVAAGNVR